MSQRRVLIVGGGPVGLGLAIELGQRGIPVTVIERHEAIQQVPKGQNLTQRTLEHFHAWGCEDALRAARTIPAAYGIGGLTAYGTLFGDYRYDWLQRERVRQFYCRDNERLPQYATEAVLRERAAHLSSIDLRLGWRGEALTQNDAGVSATIRRDDRVETVRADFAVGCDGSRSMVREAAGIGQTLSDHDRTMALLVFRSSELHEMLERFPGKSFYNVLDPALEGYWKFFGRVDDKGQFFFHAPVPNSARDGGFDFAAYLHEAAGAVFDIAFDHVGFWDLRFAVADRYRDRRIFIAGDAAHSHPPYGGYGINTGFEDARNLGWKLAASIQGWGGETLLDSYDAERRPVFESTARDFIARSIEQDRRFLEEFDPGRDRAAFEAAWAARTEAAVAEVGSFEPNYLGSPITFSSGTPSARGAHAAEAVTGKHLAPQPLADGGQLDEALGPGFTLLAGGPSDFPAAAAQLGVPLRVVDLKTSGFILVRPDQFVAWTDDAAPADPAAILNRARGAC